MAEETEKKEAKKEEAKPQEEEILLPLDKKKEEKQEEEEPSEDILMPLDEPQKPPTIAGGEVGTTQETAEEEVTEEIGEFKNLIFALRTTANREEQVMDFLTSNAQKKELEIFSVCHPHGMRGYIFVEAGSRTDAEQASFRVPYARGILPNTLDYTEIDHMLEKTKKVEVNIRKNDIAEIISGPFKREKCKIARVDKSKEEVVVELLEAAVPIPITLKMDSIKVIRRDSDESAQV